MADFDIALLRTFASVADSGGFSRAGERVHRTQSTISQHIKKLEEQAGRQLLKRSARAVQLTPDGERMLGYARRILSLHDEARNLFAEDLPDLVRIGVTDDLSVEALPQLLAPLARAHRHLRLELCCARSQQVRVDLEAGLLDVALMRTLGVDGLPALQSWDEPLYWVAAPSMEPSQRQVLDLVLYPHGCLLRSYALAQLDAQGRAWRMAYTSPSLTGVLAAVQAGMGVSLLSQRMLQGASGLRVLGPRDGLPDTPASRIVLATGPRPVSMGASQVLQLIREHMHQANEQPALAWV